MKINIKAEILLGLILNLSKVSKLNPNAKGLLIKTVEGGVELYAASPAAFASAYAEAEVVDAGTAILPLTIIPVLSAKKNMIVTLSVDLDKVVVKAGKSNVELPQFGASIDDISVRGYEPEWPRNNVDRLSDTIYACGIPEHDLDVLWCVRNKIIASDKYRIVCYRPGIEFDYDVSVPAHIVSLVEKDGMKLVIDNDFAWAGNYRFNVSSTYASIPMPAILNTVTEYIPDVTFELNTDELLHNIRLLKNLSDNIHFSVVLNITSNELVLTMDSTKANDILLQQDVLESNGEEFKIKVNVNYLYDAITNSKTKKVKLALLKMDKFNMLVIVDGEVIHYMTPTV